MKNILYYLLHTVGMFFVTLTFVVANKWGRDEIFIFFIRLLVLSTHNNNNDLVNIYHSKSTKNTAFSKPKVVDPQDHTLQAVALVAPFINFCVSYSYFLKLTVYI
ncbi:hypothetical protein BDA99DRAFT_538075 [Phascolomyces articulosus]|uniref:Uncharacterized protein n=1 Tax=Phascolomyces articulosus TaxID=60185 RepID=A0AAD5JZK4_9FUNG|nr:hypothetical protein BDA99DRAFT_538075 [Phascolomyces articulosus]